MNLGQILGGAALGAFLWQFVLWLLQRDKTRDDLDREKHERDLRALRDDLDRVKREQADLREKVAALPTKGDFQRLEQRLEEKIGELSAAVLELLSEMRKQ